MKTIALTIAAAFVLNACETPDQASNKPFTLEQIAAAHSKVRSGADFPRYISEIKSIGVKWYEHYVTYGHIQYHGAYGYTQRAGARWKRLPVTETPSPGKLQHSLKAHQQGLTDYRTFCRQAAGAGVYKWVVDLVNMRCTYYDKAGKPILAEKIPRR